MLSLRVLLIILLAIVSIERWQKSRHKKNAIALFAGTTLHRQYNKVAEAALSQAIMVQEEAAVRIKR